MKRIKTALASLLAAVLTVAAAVIALADVVYEPDDIDPEFLVGPAWFIIIPAVLLIAAAVGIFLILRAVRRSKRREAPSNDAPEDKR